jgi:hypothetical protein
MKPRPDEFKHKKEKPLNKIQKTKMEKLKNYIKELKEKFKVKCTLSFD